MVSSSCSTSGTRRVNLVTNSVILNLLNYTFDMLCYENQNINGMDTNRNKRIFDNYALPFQI